MIAPARLRRLAASSTAFLALWMSGCGSSSTPVITIPLAPTITTQPSNQTVNAGQTATFTVVAAGTGPLSYQWKKSGSAISGAISASYTTPATTAADDSSQFAVTISNAAGSITSSPATLTVDAPPTITAQPANQSVTAGQTATFTVLAAGTAPLSYQWQKGGSNIAGATSASYTTPATSLSDNQTQFSVSVNNSFGSVTSNPATLQVSAVVSTVDVSTYQYDNTRSGANQQETILTPANVNSQAFGKLGFYPADGLVDGQPLYLSQISINSVMHNALYVVTEHGSVYAFDADTGATLWQVSLLPSGETTSDNRGCTQVTPEIGITSTPAIDRGQGPNGALYTVAMSKDSSGNYNQRIHALDITSGTELFGGPVVVAATYPGTGDGSNNGQVIFDAKQYKERAGLLLLNSVVYTTWASHCDDRPYTGWIIGYDESTLAQAQVLNVTPNGNDGAIWMAGAAPAADILGNIYFLDANGTFDTTLDQNGFPVNGDYGNAFIKLSTSGVLTVADYFTMANTVAESTADEDLGSGGAVVLADVNDNSGHAHQLAFGAGKDKDIYVVDRTSMGKFNSSGNQIYQQVTSALGGSVFSKPAFFNNTVYYGAVSDSIRAFPIANAMLATSSAANTANTFKYPGATPSISANGTGNAILWAVENTNPAVLHAYDTTTLTELYNSNQASNGRDNFGNGNKFIVPIVVNGKVFVGTPNGVAVFGLLP